MSSEEKAHPTKCRNNKCEADAAAVPPQPVIETTRLILRPFTESDEERTHQQINDPEISANTRTIPYPYPRELALEWIQKRPALWLEGKDAVFAICLREADPGAEIRSETGTPTEQADSSILVGAIGLQIESADQNAELGYWLGKEYRGRGITTEAAHAIVEFGFESLALHKIFASYLARNPASGKILARIGMEQEGYFKQHSRKLGVFEDVIYCGLLNPQPGNRVRVAE